MPLLIGMQHKLALSITAALAVAASARRASANTQWVDGPPLQNFSSACGAATITRAGYNVDPSVGLTSGNIGYIHVWAVGGCASDTVGWDLALPPTAALAVSAAHPVFCFFNGSRTLPAGAECSQTPTTGNFGGLFFGFASLKAGQTFEIQIPVQWGSPSSLQVAMESAVSALTPTVYVPMNYVPQFQKLSGAMAADGVSANVSFELDSFFAVGSVVIEYGNGTFDHTTPPVNTNAMTFSFPNVTGNLPGISTGVPVTWRVRFTTPLGTFYSVTELIPATTGVLPVGPIKCTTKFC